jgi:hypothetical protein
MSVRIALLGEYIRLVPDQEMAIRSRVTETAATVLGRFPEFKNILRIVTFSRVHIESIYYGDGWNPNNHFWWVALFRDGRVIKEAWPFGEDELATTMKEFEAIQKKEQEKLFDDAWNPFNELVLKFQKVLLGTLPLLPLPISRL